MRATRLLRWLPLAALLVPAPGRSQCVLANPSFEIPGQGGAAFGGWNQFGVVAPSDESTHGVSSVRLTGPDLGGWDLSGVWQRLDTAPGDRWSATLCGWHGATSPLQGQSRAILNVEWRDAAGSLLSYESHTVADASTPFDDIQKLTVVSQPAPAGAATTHFLLGALQAPTDPAPVVWFDEAVFEEIGPPTLDDLQWNDFPGGRTLEFSGRTWRVKGPGFYGPGPNVFCDEPSCTWVDANGRLHLTIRNDASTEVVLDEALGYGDYVFTTVGRLDLLDPNAVLGLFLWQYTACYDPANLWWNPHSEADVEFSRWGDPENDLAQFIVQPWGAGHLSRFDATFAEGEVTSHAFRWLPDRMEFRSWRGGSADEAGSPPIHSWTYQGPYLPRPERPRVHVNLWHLSPPDSDQEVILEEFRFEPAPGPHAVGVPTAGRARTGNLSAVPNPFRAETSIRFTTARHGLATVDIYDVAGRRVRSLVGTALGAGAQTVRWEGRANDGRSVPPGVYFLQLRTAEAVETVRVVRVK
jgi:hypothetical protein